jgi:UDP-N-acetylmuramyl pentapeptide phosphotransferase/UDP-N-acetylglucosamine-1-phosphate transferase
LQIVNEKKWSSTNHRINSFMLYCIVFVLLIVMELVYFRVADKFNIIDKPNLRSSHTHITLRGGGVIFLFGAILYFILFGGQYPWFLLGLTLICVISFVDDIHSIPNRYRLSVHFIAMLLMCYQWGIITTDDWWIIIPALIICTGIINAYNFMDGINGITGGYSLAVLVPMMLLNRSLDFVDESLLVVTILSVLVFCFFNFRTKAKCFAGDVGSVGIAFILLFALGFLIISTGDLSYILFLAIYGVDAVLTIFHRLLLHENIFKAHRKHLYQIMANELKIPHVVVSSIYMILQFIISLGMIYLPINRWFYFCIVLVVLIMVYLWFMKKYYHLHAEYIEQVENNDDTQKI